MRLKMRWAFVILLGGFTGWQSTAWAGPVTYDYFYVSGQASYTGVTPGSTITAVLYLQEVNSDASTNSLLTSEDGLAGAGVSVAYSSSSGGGVTTITGVSPNSGSPTTGFDSILDQSYTSTSGAVLEQVNFSDSDGVAAGAQSNGVSDVFLATLTLHASSTPGQTTTFIVGAYDPNNGNTVTFNSGYDLDNNSDPLNPPGASELYSSAAPTDFSVTTAVPEPATTLLLVTVSGLMLARRKRRIEELLTRR